ncbi:hypothetical protein [Acinetobacter sp.]|uniref:hypothetical protein n=1 Tax=Acinetobacter sp. TaxID=472 RepID=UPI003751D3CB
MNPVVQQLLKAKKHSDRAEWEQKKAIIHKLLTDRPSEFYIDSRQTHTVGLTHKPSRFKIHTLKSALPTKFLGMQKVSEDFTEGFRGAGRSELLKLVQGKPYTSPMHNQIFQTKDLDIAKQLGWYDATTDAALHNKVLGRAYLLNTKVPTNSIVPPIGNYHVNTPGTFVTNNLSAKNVPSFAKITAGAVGVPSAASLSAMKNLPALMARYHSRFGMMGQLYTKFPFLRSMAKFLQPAAAVAKPLAAVAKAVPGV